MKQGGIFSIVDIPRKFIKIGEMREKISDFPLPAHYGCRIFGCDCDETAPYKPHGAGGQPGGSPAPTDVTYTFPEYKFQHYEPPVVPELRGQPSIYDVLAQRSSQTLTPLPNEKLVLLTTVVTQQRMLRQMQASVLVGTWLWGIYPPLAIGWCVFAGVSIGLGPRYEAEMIIENKKFGE